MSLLALIVAAALSMLCPMSGLPLQLDLETNLAIRRQLIEAGTGNPLEQEAQRALCARSPAFYLTYFGWTYVVKEAGADGVERPVPVGSNYRPFILWPCQVDAICDLRACVDGGRDVIGPKSRDMGYSWMVVGLASWYFNHRGDTHWRLTSRVEELVERTGDPDTLFWKLDCIHLNLPHWLLPCPRGELVRGGKFANHMVRVNPSNGSTVTGQATTEHIGKAGRVTALGIDEGHHIPVFKAAWESSTDTAASKISWSSPGNPGHFFDELWGLALEGKGPKLIKLSYDQHPLKAQGGEWRVDTDGKVTRRPGTKYFWSPWFEQQLRRRTWIDLATNVLCLRGLGGSGFFNSIAITGQLEKCVAGVRAELVKVKEGLAGREKWVFQETARGRWWVWGGINPRADHTYSIFADPSYGVGAANAIACVVNDQTREQVAEFADPSTPPLELAREMAKAAKGPFAGALWEALIGFERNGPGMEMDGHLKREGHTRIYRQRAQGEVTDRESRRYGWQSNRDTKRALFAAWDRAITWGDLTMRSADCLREALGYVVCADGSIDTAAKYDLETGAREGHGDRVVAAAGAWLISCEGYDGPPPPPPQKYGPGTYGDFLGMNEKPPEDDE